MTRSVFLFAKHSDAYRGNAIFTLEKLPLGSELITALQFHLLQTIINNTKSLEMYCKNNYLGYKIGGLAQ